MNKGIDWLQKIFDFSELDDMFSENNIITKYVEIINKNLLILSFQTYYLFNAAKNIIRTWKASLINVN